MVETHVKRFYGLDLIRSLAIMMVLFLHLCEVVPTMPTFIRELSSVGWAGVDIFFVLSGYLIGGQIYKERTSLSIYLKLRNFWVKRWFRTFPLYFFVLLIYVYIKPIAGFEFKGDVWKYIFFIQNYSSPKDFVQSWSLCVEEQFYIIFPIICYVFSFTLKKKWFWLLPVVISFVIRLIIVDSGEVHNSTKFSHLLTFPSYTHMDGISLGVFLAFTYDDWKIFFKKHHKIMLLISMFFFFLSLVYMSDKPLGHRAVLSFLLLSITSAGMVCSARFLVIPKMLEPVFYWCANLSYGMYLWNNLFARVADKYFESIHWLFSSLIFFGGTVLISYISYKIIEMPVMKVRDKFICKSN